MNDKLKKMTLEEKVSLMSGANFWNSKAIERLDIPSIMLTDGPHGVRKQGGKADHLGLNKSLNATCYPTAATLANSWDVALVKKVGEMLGEEAAYHDVSVLLGPGVNIKRNPLCGRNFEYFSEDPYLTGKLASAMIEGIQSTGISACVKHFAVNSQEHVRMSIDEIVDERALHEIYLEAFRMSIEEGKSKAIMTAYNKINGVFANEHPFLLKDVLRDQWNFEGLIVTDWGGNSDRVAALKAGNQLEMPSTNGMTDKDILDAIKNGSLDESVLDENVLSLLNFIEDVKDPKHTIYDIDLFHNLAIKAAERSIVLLENRNNLLPLSDKSSFAIIGDFAKTPRYQGAGSSLVNPTKIVSLIDAFEGLDYEYAQGYHRYGKKRKRLIDEAVKVSQKKDIIIVSLGLDESKEAEVVDRIDMKLNKVQLDLINALIKIDKPIVVLLSGGSPIELPFSDEVDSIVHGYLGGQGSGMAMKNVLFGKVNPSGKLAETYPIKYEDVVSNKYYPGNIINSEHRESIFIGYRQYDYLDQNVKYPFGYGLSYSTFELSNFKVDGNNVSVDVTNTGDIIGESVVQLYVGRENSNILRAKQELKGFSKLELEPKETKTIHMILDNHAFKHYDTESKQWESEAGIFEIRVGFSSRDIKFIEKINIAGKVYDKFIPNGYAVDQLMNISKKDFENLVGFKIAEDKYDKTQPLTYDSIILETRYRSRFGKLINGVIDLTHHTLHKMNKPIAANNVIFGQNIPFRGLARMSNGMLDMNMTDGLMMMFDKKFIKGFNHFTKSYWRKRKNDKTGN
ncbi:beta-glucosidase [Paenibacillus yanchengensis]|uniref:Beta-glucosidase n=1 Tax=Paenibacillus yanchengensis TaxID=2035833 RepID=A0ABW4YQQ7_9BACL